MRITADDLYALLPAFHRIRDEEGSRALRALVDVLAREAEVVEGDVEALYDDWFIETCRGWVAPYVGDLLGALALRPVSERQVSAKAFVANTLGYRRRAGTIAVIEQAAADVAGWPTRAVEMFALLGWNQSMKHLRPDAGGTLDLRPQRVVELVGGPFDATAHTVDVRNVRPRRGRFNVQNVAVHGFRLRSYPLEWVTARRDPGASSQRYRFDPTGMDRPLFNPRRTEESIEHRARELDLPVPLRRLELHHDLEVSRQMRANAPSGSVLATEGVVGALAGSTPAFRLRFRLAGKLAFQEVPGERIRVCHLADWKTMPRPAATASYRSEEDGSMVTLPIEVAVDPVLGRLVFAAGLDPEDVEVCFHYGFPGDLGGGAYGRQDSPGSVSAREPATWARRVGAGLAHPDFATLQGAVDAWNKLGSPVSGVIRIIDSRTYDLGPGGAPALAAIRIGEGSRLVITADEGERPHLLGDVRVVGTASAASAAPGSLILDGVVVEGTLRVEPGSSRSPGNLGDLTLAHATVLSPAASVEVAPANSRLRLRLERCVTGPVSLPGIPASVTLVACVVRPSTGVRAIDAGLAAVRVEGSTIDGSVATDSMEASDTLFLGPVAVVRRQEGCMRFSWLAPGSSTPVRFRCQPDLAERDVRDPEAAARIRDRLNPAFVSRSLSAPPFYVLAETAAAELCTGADDGSEMGAWSFLAQPHREANAVTVIDEYLRAGLEAGLFFAT